MVSWVVLALLYPLLYAISNVIDKFLLEKRLRSCFSFAIFSGWITLIFGLIILIFNPIPQLSTIQWILSIGTGLLYSAAIAIYFYTARFEEISRVISVGNLIPIFVLIGAVIFLGETLPIWKYGAIVIATFGAILVGIKKFQLKTTMRPGFWLLILYCIFIAIAYIIQKNLLADITIWNFYTLSLIGYWAGMQLAWFSKNARKHLKDATNNIHLILITEGTGLAAFLVYLVAVSTTEVSLVTAMVALQPVYVLIIMAILSIFMPKVLKEVFTKKTALLKIISVLMIVVGVFFVAL